MRKAVIIDDEHLIVSSIKVMLEKLDAGYEVVGTANDGIQGLEIIHRLVPDLLFIDVKLPGMTGLEVIEQAKAVHPDMIFVLISGYQKFEYAKKGIELGVIDYIDKPVTKEKLLKLMKRISNVQKNSTEEESALKRQNIENQLTFVYSSIFEKIDNSDDKDWHGDLESFFVLLKKQMLTMEEYKKKSYHFILAVTGKFYEKWKQYERNFRFPIYENIEALGTYQEVDEYVSIVVEQVFQKIIARKIGSTHAVILKVIGYINLNYNKDIGLSDIADMMGMNMAYLSILFKDEVGISFIKYLTKLRIDHAKDLLLEGYKVIEVSEMVGYTNCRYFCNIFKREVGSTPSEYRGNIRKK